jgi:hypothetical protein
MNDIEEAYAHVGRFFLAHPEHRAGSRMAVVDGKDELLMSGRCTLAFADWLCREGHITPHQEEDWAQHVHDVRGRKGGSCD